MHKEPTPPLYDTLFEAITAQADQKARSIIETGAVDLNKARRFGKTLLTQASVVGTDGMIALLCEHGADPNLLDDDGDHPLDCSIWDDRPEATQVLLSYGAHPARSRLGVKGLLDVISERAPDCDGVLAPFVAQQQAQELHEATAPVRSESNKPRM